MRPLYITFYWLVAVQKFLDLLLLQRNFEKRSLFGFFENLWNIRTFRFGTEFINLHYLWTIIMEVSNQLEFFLNDFFGWNSKIELFQQLPTIFPVYWKQIQKIVRPDIGNSDKLLFLYFLVVEKNFLCAVRRKSLKNIGYFCSPEMSIKSDSFNWGATSSTCLSICNLKSMNPIYEKLIAGSGVNFADTFFLRHFVKIESQRFFCQIKVLHSGITSRTNPFSNTTNRKRSSNTSYSLAVVTE